MFNKYTVARRISTVVGNENVKEKRFNELTKKKTLLEQQYPMSLIEATIIRANEMPFKPTKNYQQWGNYSFQYHL